MGTRELSLQLAAGGMDACIANEFMKGEIAGIRLFLNIPAVVIKDFNDQLDELREEETNG